MPKGTRNKGIWKAFAELGRAFKERRKKKLKRKKNLPPYKRPRKGGGYRSC